MKLTPHLLILATIAVCISACISPSSTKRSSCISSNDPKGVAAKIGTTTITNQELDDFAKGELGKLEQQFQEQSYQVRRQAIDNLVAKRLVEAQAKASGKNAEEYMKAELSDKIPPLADAEIKTLYDRAKAAGRELPPFEQIKEQIAGYLKQQKTQEATQSFYDRLKAEAKVEILLAPYQPPRVEVQAKGPARGPAKAPITIVEFSDYECPFCSRGEEVIEEVIKAYPEKVKVVFRDYPLPMHTNAPKAAEAAHCADDQGKFWDMHGKLFANQKALNTEALHEYAKSLNLDTAKFKSCLDSGEKAKMVAENQKAGADLGVTGTPAFFINGILISGAQPFQAFKDIIDGELAKK